MKAKTLKILIIILALLTAIFTWFFYVRTRMDYNSEGNYFDEESLVTYNEQSLIVYGVISFVLLSLTLLTALKLKSFMSKNKI